MEDLIGTTIKGYELTELIGEGGFGLVYRAYQESVNREVAFKVVLPEHANHPEFIRRFETEAQVVARLEHMHIVPLYDFWRDPDGAYLVMRYVRGGNLRDVLNEGALDLERIGIILDQLVSALAFVHRNKIVHRDIKPSNILFDEDGNVYLVDFGLAKLVEDRVDISQADKTITGSPDYIAPEQVRGEQVSPQTDIYSLGIVMYEMLTGEHPFADFTPIVRISKHLTESLPLIEGLPIDLAQEMNKVIRKATSKEPSARFEDVHALASNYREAAGLGPVRVVERGIVILTQREGEILEGIVAGRSNQEIARSMELEQVTIQWHMQQLYRKIGARSRAEVITQANKLDLIVEAEDKLVVHAPDVLYPMELVNPYKGLQPFQLADEGDFFGREALVSRILDRMGDEKDEANRFLAIIGPSGSGKSSLVKAGVIPALARGECPGSESWYVIDMSPSAYPLDELQASLVGIASRHIEDLKAQLGRDECGLVSAAGMILPDDDSEILLIIDQFEELYFLVEDEARRNHFLDLLCHAVTDPHSRVRVLITMRADFYDRPLQHPEFGKLIHSRMETVLPMNADELERAITNPAARVGVTFEEGLPASIISDMHAQPGALPLLQYALTELFETRSDHTLTSEGYQSIGGAVGALAKKADAVYLALKPEGQEAVRHMLTRLVAIEEGAEVSRRRVPRPELLAITEQAEVMEEVIDTFANYRLLSLDYDPMTRIPTVELAHEAILHEWGRLRNWVDEARDDIRMQRRLAIAADEWREAGKDESFHLRGTRLDQFANWAELTPLPITPEEREYLEASLASRKERRAIEAERKAREAALEQRSRRFLRALVGVLAIASVIAIGLAAFALNQRGDALDSAATATVAQGQALYDAATAVAAEAEAQHQQFNAEREARAALEAYSLSLAANAQEALNDIDTSTALVLALAANEIDQPPVRSQRILMEAAYAPGPRKQYIVTEVFEGITGSITSIDIHPGGLTALLGFENGEIILWNIQSGEEVHRFVGHSGRVNDVAFSHDGLSALSVSDDTLVIYWDIVTGQEIYRLVGHSGYVMAVDFSPDGRTAITGGFTGDFIANPGELILWDLETGQEIRRFDGHHNGVTDVEFTPEGSVVLAISGWLTFEGADIVYELFFWDIETGEVIHRIETVDHDHTRLVISPNGTTITSSANSNLYLWDLQTGEKIHTFEGNSSWTNVLDVSDDGRWAMSGSQANSIMILWDLWTREQVTLFDIQTGGINDIAISPDGRWALSSSLDGTLTFWDLVNASEIKRFEGHTAPFVMGLEFTPDGKYFVSSSGRADPGMPLSDDNSLRLWDLDTGEQIQLFEGHTDGIWSVAVSPDGERLLSGGFDQSVRLWDIESGEEIRSFEGHSTWVLEVAFLPNGERGISSDMNGTLILWDLKSGEIIRQFIGHESGGVWCLAVSPDGSKVLEGGNDGWVFLWDLETGEQLLRFESHWKDNVTVSGVAISPDGRFAITGGTDGTLIQWNLETGEEIQRLKGHTGVQTRISISFDGRTAFSSEGDGTLILWDLETGTELRRLKAPDVGWTLESALSPDGRIGLSVVNNTIIQWQLAVPMLDELRDWISVNRYVRELNCQEREIYRIEPLCE